MNIKPLAFFVSCALSTPVIAADAPSESTLSTDEQVFEIKAVVVNATRVETTEDEVTRPLAVVEKEQLDAIQPQSVAEAVSYEPNIAVSGGPRANNQSVNIRGLSGNKVLQTIDGVRQVFESGHRPSYFLDPELLTSIEVVKGPASSLWGSGAVAGVVAQNTVSAGDLLAPEQNLGGFIKTGYNDNNDKSTTTGAIAGRTDSLDLLFSAYYRNSNDAELGDGSRLIGSASIDKGMMGKAEWQIDDHQSLGFNVRAANVSGSVPSNGSADPNGSSNFLINCDQDTANIALDYRINTQSPYLNAQVKAYWNSVDMDEERVSDGRSDATELDVYGININNVSTVGDVTLLYGIDGHTEDFKAERGGDNRPTPPDAETDIWGGFIQASYPVAKNWSVEVGARYDYFSTEAKNLTEDRSDNDLSPSAALIWQAQDWLELTLRHDRAFRAPSSEELYSTGYHFCMFEGFCNSFEPNPDLKPEQAANTELMAKAKFGGVFAENDGLQIQTSVFQNKVDDFIEQIVTDPTFYPVMDPGKTYWYNVDEATIEGFEISANYRYQAFNATLAYGIVRGEDDITGEDLTNIPADTLSADLSYAFLSEQLKAGVRVIHAKDQTRTDYEENLDGTTYDGYTVGDLYVSYQPSSLAALKLDLTINNVTDKHYRQAWDELDQVGREVIFSAKYSF
ncbi:TonB-dependent hemoglobin/transferrin/lactoferrin family receptor [Neiella marina]|uniref:TonB-dependent hemoglobin/transferrin/lactoferrin family receptor n=1 Tax=Neiella holothuriorum TaxID=2870530 RepID=A0ABS7EGW3_9GAMM|nr:TonB-dependent hemoglobin/transferrin/lactoferrin family receptor [Neiella holothuriorum]MBW8191586.1 TonB-dependent hemoglobin/transferrin/lactoferrin family receptor [Neiella holothuriorum]